jgi:N,N'-diacetyllegionaminate synthase
MSKKVIVIAEAGVNHNGDLEKALALVDAAADAGADYVKFQTFKAEKIVSHSAQKADYQKNNMLGDEDTQLGMLQKLEMGEEWYPNLIERCADRGIKFLSTGFDEDSIEFLNNLNIPFFKIPSGEITNKPYLKLIASKGKKVILSSGMAYLHEIESALQILEKEGMSRDNIVVLHCNTEYPTPVEDVNLAAMNQIRDKLRVQVGYSDHTMGIEIAIAAVALGAVVIEKHFTLNRSLPGPDHAASLEPAELKNLVESIRNIEKAINGSGLKEPSKSELKNINAVRKSLHYVQDLPVNHIITNSDIIALRPGTGISPMEIDEIIGKKLKKGVYGSSKVDLQDFYD